MLRCLIALLILAGGSTWAYDPSHPFVSGHELPKELEGVGVTEHLGDQLDMSLPFTDDNGQKTTLGELMNDGQPALLAMVYYTCPNLCNFHLNGMVDALKQIKWTPGKDFKLIAVSMNSKEGPDVAAKKKANYIKSYGRPESVTGWHFLTGDEDSIQKLAKQLGFRFRWLPDEKQFSHTSVSYVLTPGGRISRYIYGIGPESQTFKLSLIEASSGKIGTVMDQILLFCFHFDPGKNKYTLYAWNVMRIGGGLMVLLLAIFLIPAWRRERSQRRLSQ
jgi:protein SCO1